MGGEMPQTGALRGPRGGTTTVSGDRVRKNLWITREEAEALRRRAFESRRTETDLMREGLRWLLGLDEVQRAG